MTAPATTSRSDLLRGRVRDLDALQRGAAAAPGGVAEPGVEAKRTAPTQRIANAKKDVAGELSRRDRMDRLRTESAALRQHGLGEMARMARADEQLAGMQKEFRGKYPERPLRREYLAPQDRARYETVEQERKRAAAAIEKDKAGIEKRKAEYAELRKEADEKEKVEGETEGDVADPCVSSGASEIELLEEEARLEVEERLVLARELTEKGGSGDDADEELVALELAKLPKSALERMKADGTKVVACRGSVTDYASSLNGVQPRGWDPGDTWDIVPGMYDKTTNKVVIATTGHGTPGGARVPVPGEGHGCANLTLHEAMHALDFGGGGATRSAGKDFNSARTADLPKLGTYETQAGSAGQEETWAESGARYCDGGGGTTNLDDFWRNYPPGAPPAAPPAATATTGGGT